MKTFLSHSFFVMPFPLGKHHKFYTSGNDEPGKGTIVLVVEMKNTGRGKHAHACQNFSQNTDLNAVLSHGIMKASTDPNNQQGVRGWHHLKDADLMLIGTRFRRPSPEEAKHITNFLNAETNHRTGTQPMPLLVMAHLGKRFPWSV